MQPIWAIALQASGIAEYHSSSMDNEDLYDEFGNFIGGSNDSGSESFSGSDLEPVDEEVSDEEAPHDVDVEQNTDSALVTTDDLSQSFSGAETIIVEPKQVPENQPVLRADLQKRTHIEFTAESAEDLPETTYSREYMLKLANDLPERIRNVAFVGNLHTGKTSLIDSLVLETHPTVTLSKKDMQELKPLRYLDTHVLERGRGMSIFAHPMTLLLPDHRDRSLVLNILDCPGHPEFDDETQLMLEVADGAVLVLDAVEGLSKRDKRLITSIMKRNIPFTVVLNKIDRLIIELRLPVSDFYLKLRHIINDINATIHHNEFALLYKHKKLISPLEGNVVFASNVFQVSFSLKSFGDIYARQLEDGKKPSIQFESLLWGDLYYNESTRKFAKDKKLGKRTFDHFVLEPLYKLVTYTITTDNKNLKNLSKILWENFRITLKKDQLEKDPQEMLRVTLSRIFGFTRDLVMLISTSVPSPEKADSNNENLPDPAHNEVVATVIKHAFSSNYGTRFALVKVRKGAISTGDSVKLLFNKEGDSKNVRVGAIRIPAGRYTFTAQRVSAGMFAYIEGFESINVSTATIYSKNVPSNKMVPLHRVSSGQRSVFKVALEPEYPHELPRLVESLRKLSLTYISSVIKLEESGEHVLLAPGELYLDIFLHDLRNSFDEYLSIKVSDPMVKFGETSSEMSATKLPSYGPSKKTHISITAEPFDDRNFSKAVTKGTLDVCQPLRNLSKTLRNEFGWDALAARSLWVLGPSDMQQPSTLLDDTISNETDKNTLLSFKEPILKGFKLGVEEGPLCGEPVRNTKFKILDAVLSSSNISSHGAQITTMTRNAVHTGLLTAAPRLLEPVYRVSIVCTMRSVQAAQIILDKRRGWIVSEIPIPASPLFELEGFVPVIDSVGLDTDMRLQTQGQAMCLVEFDRWKVVPGDPLDKNVPMPSLRPVPHESMARDFVMKTRRRKGLSDEPNLQKYIDPSLFSRLRETGLID